jgi:hypothetical protein
MEENIARLYKYVGSHDIRQKVAGLPLGRRIKSVSELEDWIQQNRQQTDRWGLIYATFVVDLEGYFRVADRHSEHLACAGSQPVLSAGEVFFTYGDRGLEVAEITNQSTGFCPEPESWLQVAKALDIIPLPHPLGFTIEFVFRRCFACNQINIVKEHLFLCAVCGKALPSAWNFDY